MCFEKKREYRFTIYNNCLWSPGSTNQPLVQHPIEFNFASAFCCFKDRLSRATHKTPSHVCKAPIPSPSTNRRGVSINFVRTHHPPFQSHFLHFYRKKSTMMMLMAKKPVTGSTSRRSRVCISIPVMQLQNLWTAASGRMGLLFHVHRVVVGLYGEILMGDCAGKKWIRVTWGSVDGRSWERVLIENWGSR